MKVFCENTHWRVLLEEGDNGSASIMTPPEIKTVQYGHLRKGIQHWDQEIHPVPEQTTIRVVVDRNPELDARSVAEHKVKHPFDLYSLVEPDSETESEREMMRELLPKPEKSSLHLVKKQKSKGRLWEVKGRGKNASLNNLKIDLNGMPDAEFVKTRRVLTGLKWDWRANKQLVPVTPNLTEIAQHVKSDPKCIIKVLPKDKVQVLFNDKTRVKRLNRYKFGIKDKHGHDLTLDLTNYPNRDALSESMAWMQFNLDNQISLTPVLEHGVISQGPFPSQYPVPPLRGPGISRSSTYSLREQTSASGQPVFENRGVSTFDIDTPSGSGYQPAARPHFERTRSHESASD